MKKWMALLLLLCLQGGVSRAEELTVRFLCMDRNDAILLECGGETAFLDSGTHEYGKRAVTALRGLGITKLTYYIGTHAHRDHVGGGSVILEALRPKTVLQPHDGVRRQILSCAETKEEQAAAKEAAYRTLLPGEEIPLGGATLKVLGPLRLREETKYSDMENNNSLVLRVSYGKRVILLTADAMPEEIQEIAKRDPESLRCDVLKSPHHNSDPGEELLSAAWPSHVVFSTSDKALPTKTALTQVAGIGAMPLVTAQNQCGMITVRTDGETLTVEAEREPERIAFAQNRISLYAGTRKNPALSTKPAGYKAIAITGENPGIAAVDAAGIVHGITPGETIIRAKTHGGLSAECIVLVKAVTVSLNADSIRLKPGETRKLRMKIQPSSLKRDVRWVSDNPDVATVNRTGMVRAVSSGKTNVRLLAPGGAEAVCVVTVK